MLAAIAVILYLSYIVSRKLGSGMLRTGMSGNIRVVEKAYIDRDKSVVIVRVGRKDYLLGVSQNSVCLLQELEEGQVEFTETEDELSMPAAQFAAAMKSRLKKEK